MEAPPPARGESRTRKFVKQALGWLALQGLGVLLRYLLDL